MPSADVVSLMMNEPDLDVEIVSGEVVRGMEKPAQASKSKRGLAYAFRRVVREVAAGGCERMGEGQAAVVAMDVVRYTKSHATRFGWDARRPDLDHIDRAVLNGLIGVVWPDDSQVVARLATKTVRRRQEGDPALRIRVRVWECGGCVTVPCVWEGPRVWCRAAVKARREGGCDAVDAIR